MLTSADRTSRRKWTAAELAALREHYPRGGVAAVATLHARHSPRSISAQAWKLGVRYRPPRASKIPTDEHIDEAIRRHYLGTGPRDRTKVFASRIGRPAWWVKKRATALGIAVSRERQPEWTEAELDLLERNAHRVIPVLRRIFARNGFSRTETAIAVQLKRRGISRTSTDAWSAHELSQLLGVDGKTVTRWIASQGLAAKRRGTQRLSSQGGDEWVITRRSLRQWIATHQQLVDLRKVDRFWFLDLAFGGDR